MGGRAHTDECRRRVIQQMIDSNDPEYIGQFQQCVKRTESYFATIEEAFNTAMLTTETRDHPNAEPTSPAVRSGEAAESVRAESSRPKGDDVNLDPTPPGAKDKKLKKLKIMTSKGYREVQR